VELQDGDRIGVGGRTWEVSLGGAFGSPAAFTEAAGHRVEIPPRRGEVPLLGFPVPILQPYGVTQATYPLAWLEAVAAWRERAGGGLGPRAEAESQRAGFFFFEPDGLAGGSLWLAPSRSGVSIERAGRPVEIPAWIGLEPGHRLHFLSPPRWDGREVLAGGVRDRRSFRVLPGRRSVALLYDTPEVHSLSAEELAALEIGRRGAGRSPRVNLSLGDWQVSDRSLHFRHAPDAVAVEALATLELPGRRLGGLLGEASELTLTTPRGSRTALFGEPLWVGGERQLAAVQFDRLRPPLALGLLGLALVLAKAAAARAGRLPVSGALLAAGLEGIITLRVLMAYRVAALPPLDQEALELAGVAWALFPWSLIVLALPPVGASARPRRRERGLPVGVLDWLPALAGWMFSLSWCLRLGGGSLRSLVWLAFHLTVLAVPVARSLGLEALYRAGAGSRARLRELLTGRRELALWAALPLVFTAVRALLLLLGFRESVSLGGTRFALSLAHVPAALLLQAGYLVWLRRRVGERGEVRWEDHLPGLSIVLGVWVLPALLVSDLGLALLNLPVFLLAAAWVVLAGERRARPSRRGRGARLAGAAPAVALVLVLGLVATPLLARALVVVVPETWKARLESERNYLRLLEFSDPEELQRVARRQSEELSIMSAVMRSYTSGPVAGRGYFGSEVSPHIRSTAVREHAPAVFVAAEWGVLGTTGLLLLYCVIAAAGVSFAPGRDGDRPRPARSGAPGVFWRAAGALAALTLAVPSVYMVLANYRLTLFTGKNAYLLGIDSTADVLESFLLTALVVVGLVALREAEGRP
jgi:hypothetical protein